MNALRASTLPLWPCRKSAIDRKCRSAKMHVAAGQSAAKGEESIVSDVKRASAAGIAALSILFAPNIDALAADRVALQQKGHVFAEASADVLRAAPAGDLRNVISAAVDVAVSVNPDRAIFAVDAGLEALETASAGDLLNLVKAAEHATSAAITNGQLIPSDEEIDKVVDAAAVVAGGVNPNSLSKFAKAATEAATTADGKKIGNLTLQGGKLGLAVGPGKITTATAAALDLFTAL